VAGGAQADLVKLRAPGWLGKAPRGNLGARHDVGEHIFVLAFTCGKRYGDRSVVSAKTFWSTVNSSALLPSLRQVKVCPWILPVPCTKLRHALARTPTYPFRAFAMSSFQVLT
jgi:hypothetical protein